MQTYTNEEISELKSHKYYMVSQGKVLHVMKKSWILKNKKKEQMNMTETHAIDNGLLVSIWEGEEGMGKNKMLKINE